MTEQMACRGEKIAITTKWPIVEELETFTTCCRRAKDHRSPGGERKRTRERTIPLSLSQKDEVLPSSLRPMLEPFQRHIHIRGAGGNFRETGWSSYGLSCTRRYHLV